MTTSSSRYSDVTRRAFLGGLSIAAIAGTAACSGSSTATTSAAGTTTSAAGAATSAATTASAAAGGTALAASAQATIAWTVSSSGKNPYMAVWIEDASGAFVKTVALYHKSDNDRWLNSLTSWYQASGGADTTTSGTVPAGSFTATWDGSTAAGGRAAAGSYFVCVESSVEHGSESLVRQSVAFGSAAAKTDLTASGDISAASVDYTI